MPCKRGSAITANTASSVSCRARKRSSTAPKPRDEVHGVAHSRLWGDWPFQSLATHREAPDKGEYSALWSEEDKDVFKINRGGWSLSPPARGQTHAPRVHAANRGERLPELHR